MYLPITGDDLFYKHRDGCGDVRNHFTVLSITVVEEIYEYGSEEPILYICEVDMFWYDDYGVVYTFSDYETEDPDDYDAAVEYIVSEVK